MTITIVQGAFLPVPPLRGGAIEKAFYDLAREFVCLGNPVKYFSRLCDGLPSDGVDSANIHHFRVPGFDSPKSIILHKFYDLLYSMRVLRKLSKSDILVTHTFWLPLLIRNYKRFGHVYVHVGRAPKGQMKFYLRSSRLQTVSSPISKLIESEISFCKHSLISTIPYPISDAFLQTPLNLKQKKQIVLYAGRIHQEKGIDLLIKAFQGIPDSVKRNWKLNIMGPWELSHGGGGKGYLEYLLALINNDPSISIIKSVFNQTELIQKYDDASIFVYPSMAEIGETFGLAALEAMSRGCITVVSSLPCFSDFIYSGYNGYIFDHRCTEHEFNLQYLLTKIIRDVHSNINNSLRQTAIHTTTNYSTSNIANRFLLDFERILCNHS